MGTTFSNQSASNNDYFKSINPVDRISFTINGKLYTVKPDGIKINTTTSLNAFIRNVAKLKGTKMMCLEGGCGSCIVSVQYEHPVTKQYVIEAVNSCLVLLLSCNGWKITTIEGIGNRKIGYHLTQKRLAEFNGTQCGFCSPGMVMNMYSLYQQTKKQITEKEVENSFGGNICRCTGYRPIADAFKSLASDANPKLLAKCMDLEELKICPKTNMECGNDVCENEDKNWQIIPNEYIFMETKNGKWFKVFTVDEILNVLNAIGNVKYMLVSGNTASGVKRLDDDIEVFIDITSVNELHELLIADDLVFGANTSLTELISICKKVAKEKMEFLYLTEMASHIDLVANVPVRNIGTVAGNLALKHGFKRFQSDVFLLLETFGAKLKIVDKNGSTPIVVTPKEFLDLDMNGRIIVNVTLFPLKGNFVYQTYKIMPRAQNTHAIVNAGFLMELSNDIDTVKSATIVYGAINTDFVHATDTEKKLIGKQLFNDDTLQLVFKSLDDELQCDVATPDPPPEARKQLAIALFYKFILKTAPDRYIPDSYKSGGIKFDRPVSSGSQKYQTQENEYPLTQPIPKLEALAQTSGEAKYVVDLDTVTNDVSYAAIILANVIPGSKIKNIHLDKVKEYEGVIDVLTSKDIPGKNRFNVPEIGYTIDAEIFASEIIKYNGQPVGIIVAETEDIANEALKLVQIETIPPSKDEPKPLYTTRDAINRENNQRIYLRGTRESTDQGKDVQKVFKGTFDMGPQYHFTLETQSCVCIPIEDGLDVYSSTQWMNATQAAIADCLSLPLNKVNMFVRRLGGGYGAKISRCNLTATACAIASWVLQKPVYLRMRMENNIMALGKRFPYSADYEVGVNKNGKIQYLNLSYWSNTGYYTNETIAEAMLDCLINCYDPQYWNLKAYDLETDVAGNTFCRAPGNLESIGMIETIMEHISFEMNLDPRLVRNANFLGGEQNPLFSLQLNFAKTSKIDERIENIKQFNKDNRWRKRGIAGVTIDFEFVFAGIFYAQVSIFAIDGTVAITHGGIEMGQGINTKVAQVAAHFLGINLDQIQVKQSMSLTSPNNDVTGGSVGSESVSYATMKACQILMERMKPAKEKLGNNYTWLKMVQLSQEMNVNLNASYMFSPQLDNVKNYPVYGVTFAEVEIDILTGLIQILRVDLLEDTGESMSPEVDIGQIEGAFIMGLGYWLTENIDYDSKDGALLNTRTWTYHPPGMKDIPIDWRIEFRKNAPNPVGVLRSKATGEPPICMSISVVLAIRRAVAEARRSSDPQAKSWFPIDGPTTTDVILMQCLPNYKQYKLNV